MMVWYLHFVVEDFGFACGSRLDKMLVQYIQYVLTDLLQLIFHLKVMSSRIVIGNTWVTPRQYRI